MSDTCRVRATGALIAVVVVWSAAAPFIRFLDSPVWTDRNKASLALMMLSERRDPALLAALRRDAIAPLAEMARWKSTGHAQPAFITLARIAGYSDETALTAWASGDRDTIIKAAEETRR